MIEAEPGDDPAQPGFQVADVIAVGAQTTQERILHDILGLRHRAEHPVGDPHQPRAQRIERRCAGVPRVYGRGEHGGSLPA